MADKQTECESASSEVNGKKISSDVTAVGVCEHRGGNSSSLHYLPGGLDVAILRAMKLSNQ